MLLNITKKQLKKAEEYAQKVQVSYYAIKYQQPATTARRQHLTGKIGEFALYNLFTELGYTLKEPDITVHTKKRHEPDLLLNNKPIHIKTQREEEAKKYGSSWLFKKKALPTEGLIALITLNSDNTIYLEALLPYKTFIPLYKEPKLDKLKNDIVALYAQDLPINPYINAVKRRKYAIDK